MISPKYYVIMNVMTSSIRFELEIFTDDIEQKTSNFPAQKYFNQKIS